MCWPAQSCAMSTAKKFGTALRELRKLRNLTQEELSSRIGRSVDAVSQWERGINSPSFETLMLLAAALDVPAKTFFEYLDTDLPEARFKLELAAITMLSDLSDSDLLVAVEQIRALANRR
jgi:transcriptional regulator with XRE-family HTH domain